MLSDLVLSSAAEPLRVWLSERDLGKHFYRLGSYCSTAVGSVYFYKLADKLAQLV